MRKVFEDKKRKRKVRKYFRNLNVSEGVVENVEIDDLVIDEEVKGYRYKSKYECIMITK